MGELLALVGSESPTKVSVSAEIAQFESSADIVCMDRSRRLCNIFLECYFSFRKPRSEGKSEISNDL